VITTTLPSLTLRADLPPDADVLVVGSRLSGDRGTIYGLPQGVDTASLDLDLLSVGAPARTELGTVSLLGRLASGARVFAVGLGSKALEATVLRRAAGAALRHLAGQAGDGAELRVAISLHEASVIMPTSVYDMVRAVGEGALLGTYVPVKATGQRPSGARIGSVTIIDPAAEEHAGQARLAGILAGAVARTRDLVNLPANVLYPQTFAEEVTSWFAGLPVEIDIRDEHQLAAEGFGGIVAVGQGSVHPPRLVRVAYSPADATQKLVLVGKGITFDSGGLDIKPSSGMLEMRCDMGGAAAVLAATHAIAELGLNVAVVAYAAMAENMPSGSAYRPSDVITMHDGTTVQVSNTDAEGRLVLADGLSAAQPDDPELVIDVATLTGACIRALGPRTIGLVASSESVASRLTHAAEVAGEPMWQLPLTDEARDALRTPWADLRSAHNEPHLGMQVAAAFLEHFAGEGRNWAHLDIAGPAWHAGAAEDIFATGATGSAVRSLVEVALTME